MEEANVKLGSTDETLHQTPRGREKEREESAQVWHRRQKLAPNFRKSWQTGQPRESIRTASQGGRSRWLAPFICSCLLLSGCLLLEQRFSTGVRKFLKLGIPDYVVRGADLFPRRSSDKKNDNSHDNHSRLVCMKQNYTFFFGVLAEF